MEIKNRNGTVMCEVPGDSLVGATLKGANLRWADLRGANLRGADLSGADLSCADLREADLQDAHLHLANLYMADLDGAILPPAIAPEGEFIAYKKVEREDGSYRVITLRIPADAQRTSALISRKCRASHVIVVDGEGFSFMSKNILCYKQGETVYADGFDSDRSRECTRGIHFFMTREEAEAY